MAALSQGAIYKIKSMSVATDVPSNVTNFSLAPNPTDSTVRIGLELKKREQVVLTLLDARQSRVYAKKVSGQRIEEVIDLSLLPVGTYFLVVELENGNLVRQVVRK